jgi:hypothetical protein
MLDEIKEYIEVGEEIFNHIANDSTIIKSVAKCYSKFYDELIKEEFTHEDAIRIICSLKLGK